MLFLHDLLITAVFFCFLIKTSICLLAPQQPPSGAENHLNPKLMELQTPQALWAYCTLIKAIAGERAGLTAQTKGVALLQAADRAQGQGDAGDGAVAWPPLSYQRCASEGALLTPSSGLFRLLGSLDLHLSSLFSCVVWTWRSPDPAVRLRGPPGEEMRLRNKPRKKNWCFSSACGRKWVWTTGLSNKPWVFPDHALSHVLYIRYCIYTQMQ